MSLQKLEKGRQTVGGWLSTWEQRRRELMCCHIVSDELVTLKEKIVLYPFNATYLRHAIGEYARVRLGISTVLLSLGSKEEHTPISSLEDVTYRVVDRLTSGFYEDMGKRHRSYWLRTAIKQELLKWIACGVMDRPSKDLVRVEPVVPELIVLNHFAPVIYHSCGKSSWKRCVTSATVGIGSGVTFAEIPNLIKGLYSGEEYNYRTPKDLDTWWLIHGEEGSMFVIKDRGGRTYLQYNKRTYDKDIGMDSAALQSILKTVKALPFIDRDLLTQLHGTSNYLEFLETMKRYPEATPLKLGSSFVNPGLAFLLRLGLKVDLEEHPMSTIISILYKECKPRRNEIEHFGSTIKNIAHELTTAQEFTAREYEQRIVGKALARLGFVKQEPKKDIFTVVKGFRDTIATLSRFSGNIFDK